MTDIDIADTTSSQRATFYIPTYESIVGLGASYDVEGTTLTQSGFSMTTTRHVFVRAAKAATVQANGDVWAQSLSSSTYALSGKSSYFVAKNDLYVAAAGLTGLYTTYGGEPVDATNQDDSDLGTPDGVSSINTLAAACDITWGVFALGISVLNRGKDLHEFIVLKKSKEEGWGGLKKVWNWAKLIGFQLWTVYSSFSYISNSIFGLPLHAISLHGTAGVLMGTPSTHNIYGSAGVTTSSFNNSLLGLVQLSFEAGYQVYMDSIWGETNLVAGTEMTVLGGTYAKHASRWAGQSYYGKTVSVGRNLPSGKQLPTLKSELDTVLKASFEAIVPSTSAITLGNLASMKTSLTAKKAVKATVGNQTQILSVGTYTIMLTPTTVTVSSVAEGTLLTMSAAPPTITFGHAASSISMTPTTASIGGASLQVTPTGLMTTAGFLEIL